MTPSPRPSLDACPPALVRWPVQRDARDACARDGVPCLMVIEAGTAIPMVGRGEDWIWSDADEREAAARLRRLAAIGRRAGSWVPPDGLGPLDGRAGPVAAALAVDPGVLVPIEAIRAQAGSDAEVRAVLRRIRVALVDTSWCVVAARGAGFVLLPRSAA